MVEKRLDKIAKKYSLSSGNDKHKVAQLCFASVLDSLLRKAKIKSPVLLSRLSKKNSLTVIDVGSGYFRYGKALYEVLSKINKNIRLIAVDKKKFFNNERYDPAKFVKGNINRIAPKLVKLGIKNIDIFTVFNPFQNTINLTKIPKNLREHALLIGCVDWNIELFKELLKDNGFKAIVWQKNDYRGLMRLWFNNYDPFVFAYPFRSN